MSELRKSLPPLPSRMTHLPLDRRGYPIPWFVAEVNGERDFRVADARKRELAARDRRCWVCGEPIGRLVSFVIGPMCAVNRNTSEPGCHRDCAIFSATACPFLTLPKSDYRGANLPDGVTMPPGALDGNPGVACIWITRAYRPYRVPGSNDWLITLGEPEEVLWYCEGREATRADVIACLEQRLPLLENVAREEGDEALTLFKEYVRRAMKLVPA